MPKKITEEIIDDRRDLATRKFDTFGNFEIYRQGGGKKPDELDGVYTSEAKAKSRLEAYLETQGILNEAKKLKAQIKSINPLDQQVFDDDE